MRRLHAGARGIPPLTGLILVLAGGCSVGPRYTRPATPLPESWSPAHEAQIVPRTAADARWWKAFNDPVLDQLVELAAQQNLPLQVAGLRIVEARAQLGIASSRQFPQLQLLTGSVTAQRINSGLADAARLGRHFFIYELSLEAAWEIDFWGKYRRGIEAQADRLSASVADQQSALVSLTGEVARTYVLMRTYETLIARAQENVRLQEEGLRIAESRFRNGATSELDVTQAATLLEDTRTTIPELQAQLEQARNALSTLLGQPPGTLQPLLKPGPIPTAPERLLVGVPADMLRRRPDVRSAELQAAAQSAEVGIARADLLPSFTLLGSVGLQDFSSSTGSHNPFSGDNFVYTISPRITWEFFNYGRFENRVRVEDARYQQLLLNYRNTVLTAAREVEDAISGYLTSQQAMVSAQRALASAERSVKLAFIQYREGAADFTRVLDAERALLEQQNSLTQTQASVATSMILVYKSLGGGWEVREGQPFVPEAIRNEMERRTDWGDLVWKPRWPEAVQTIPPEKP